MLSLSTGSGVQVGFGCTGDVMLPSRIDVGKHSRITAMGYKIKITRKVISSGEILCKLIREIGNRFHKFC